MEKILNEILRELKETNRKIEKLNKDLINYIGFIIQTIKQQEAKWQHSVQ